MSSSPRTLTVPESLDGARLDKALTVLAQVSRSGAKALLETGVRVNGRRAVKGGVVHTGDVLELATSESAPTEAAATPDPDVAIEVLLETDMVLVVSKPARLPTAPLRGGERGTLAGGILARYPEIAGVGPDPREPGLVHRLDTDPSGLVIVARNAVAYEALKTALRAGEVDKRYLAIVAPGVASNRASSVATGGELAERGTIDVPIAPHPKDKRRVFACVHQRDIQRLAPRDARTTYKVLRRWTTQEGEARALVEATAPRALRHQVRVHFAAISAPLVGDGLYGGPSAPALGRHALHASRVSYAGGAEVDGFVVEAPLPDDLAALLPDDQGAS